MKLNTRDIFRISLIYTLVTAFPPILQLLAQPLMEGTDLLNEIDFAYISIAELFTSFSFILCAFAMGTTVSRFYYEAKEGTSHYNNIVSTIFSSILFRFFLLLLLAFFFGKQLGLFFTEPALRNFESYGYLSIGIGLNRALITNFVNLLRNRKKVAFFSVTQILYGIFRTAGQLIGLFYFRMDFIGFLWGGFIGTSIISLGTIAYIYSIHGIRFNLNVFKETHSFAWPLFQYSLVAWAFTIADRFLLEKTPADLGIYNTALNFAIGIQIVVQGLQGAIQPELFRFMKDGIQKNIENIKKLSHLLLAQVQLFVAVAILPVMAYLHYFYETKLQVAAGLISLIFFRYILKNQYYIFSLPIIFIKKTKVFLYLNSIILIINIALNIFLIPIWGMYGAITAFMISDLFQALGMYFYQKRTLPIKWNLKKAVTYPFLLVLFAVVLEITKLRLEINPFITAGVSVFLIISSLFILYKKELIGIYLKYLKPRLTKK